MSGQGRGIFQSISVGLVNQVVTSATNFGLSLYLVRALSLESFGLWALAFSALLLFVGLANGTLITPMVVGYARRGPRRADSWLRSMLAGCAGFGLLVALIVSVFGLVGWWLGGFAHPILSLSLALSVAAALASVLHCFVRVAFCRHRETVALTMNLILLAAVLAVLVVVQLTGTAMSAALAMWIYGLAHVLALAFAWPLWPASKSAASDSALTTRLRGVRLRRHMSEAWLDGRWAMAGVWVSWAQSQIYIYLTPLFAGLAALGMINAARMLVAPLIMLAPAINQIALPRFSQMHAAKEGSMLRVGSLSSIVLLLIALAYGLVVAFFYRPLANLLLGAPHPELYWIAVTWCLFAAITLVRQLATVLMQAAQRFFALFVREAVILPVTILLIGLLLKLVGLPGAVLASAAGEALIAALVWRNLVSANQAGDQVKAHPQRVA